jgi:hypothetical protein
MFIFNSRINTLTVILRPSRRTVIGTEVVHEGSLKARFENGLFTTDDPEVAELLRKKVELTHDRGIVEIASEEELAFRKAQKALNSRTAVTAAETSKAIAGPIKLEEKAEGSDTVKCPICDPPKHFKNQKALNMHLLSHRPGVKVAQPAVAEIETEK